MKICLTAQGDNLDCQTDARFGRCKYFIFFDTQTQSFEAVLNSNTDAAGGAGIRSGQLVAEKYVEAVITGNVGPNAIKTLTAAGIKVFTSASGTIRQAIEDYKNGRLQETYSASTASKSGI